MDRQLPTGLLFALVVCKGDDEPAVWTEVVPALRTCAPVSFAHCFARRRRTSSQSAWAVPARRSRCKQKRVWSPALTSWKTNTLMVKLRSQNGEQANPWFSCSRTNPDARLRLFCFPHAGAGVTVYRSWADRLPDVVEVYSVNYPGRGIRIAERPFTDAQSMVQALAADLNLFLEKPFAFFGYSMGALISFELARRLLTDHRLQPVRLFAAACPAPQQTHFEQPIFDLPEPEFIERLRNLKGTPAAVLQDRDLMQLMVPTLRADFQVCQTYEYSPGALLSCPIAAFGGLWDESVTQAHLNGWGEQTIAWFALRMFPGDHFFLHQCESALLEVLSWQLRECAIACGSRPH